MTDSTDKDLAALRASFERLAALVEGLGSDLEAQAYPSQWNVAQVVSHLGSGATIFQRRLEDSLAGQETPADFNQATWDEWDAKPALAQAHDGIAADSSLLIFLESLSERDRDRLHLPMGPLMPDYATFVGMRLSEHVLHTWDVEVVADPGATLPVLEAEQVLDRLGFIAARTGKPSSAYHNVVVRTTNPESALRISLTPQVGIERVSAGRQADLTLPAEALVRLVYGRLDPEHTPAFNGDPALLDELRRVFPGL